MGIFDRKPPTTAPRPMPQTTSGVVNAVPCCHCGKPNNLAGHDEMLDTGTVFDCDHCKRPFQVAAIRTTKIVSVRAPRGRVQSVKPR